MTVESSLAASRHHAGTAFVVLLYIVFYASVIHQGHGLPYVMDNNETFSALVHAHNFWTFDFTTTFGLADDTVSPSAAAHPIVHTHQGNFPRIFTSLLYGLGARTAESQIWITTFTVGLASVLLAKGFFRRLGGDVFATIATTLLITDYLLYAQWQVNTYRVWHGFFLFGSLTCAHGFAEWSRRRWALATIALYACLLYWELIFAAFVSVSTGVYTLWIYRQAIRSATLAACTQAAGAVLGLGVLAIQAVLYLGWRDFVTDIRLTYIARNQELDPHSALAVLHEFYEPRNITFWYNIQTGDEYHGVLALVRSIFSNAFQVQTPLFTSICLITIVGVLLSGVRRPRIADVGALRRDVSDASISVLAVGFFSFLMMLGQSDAVLGLLPLIGITDVIALPVVVSVLPVFACLLAIALRRLATMIAPSGTPPALGRCVVASLFLFAIGVLLRIQGSLYDQSYVSFWAGMITPVSATVGKIAVFATSCTASLLILAERSPGSELSPFIRSKLVPFFASGIVGLSFVYIFAAGYLHTGYLYRLCPLVVFHIDALLALGIFIPVQAALATSQQIKLPGQVTAYRLTMISWSAVACFLSLYWAAVQYRYIAVLPPTRFSFVQQLKSIIRDRQGIVSNTYAAPFGFVTGTWAYMDTRFGDATAMNDRRPGEEYRWFADRARNHAYSRPDVFICFNQLSYYPRLIDPSYPLLLTVPRCSDLPMMRTRARQRLENLSFDFNVLAYDDKDNLWAVYEIKWKTP